jgi:DNA-binding CsgD family transcriptional regulator
VLQAEPGSRPVLQGGAVDDGLAVIADFADLKSFFTVGHSSGVAELAARAAERERLGPSEVVAVRRAGLVHDVGRVAASVLIWDKEGPLTVDELERVRLHPYHLERVFARSPFLREVAALASQHHERLDGSGYHRGERAPNLSPAARILAAADAYHAMTEPRPHRPAFEPSRAAELLVAEARAGRLDPEAVNAVVASAGHDAHRAGAARARAEHPAGLTDREVEVLRLLARGMAVKQVARTLGIAFKTADRHIQNVYAKAGVSTRAAAAVFAMQHGMVPWGESPMSAPAPRT